VDIATTATLDALRQVTHGLFPAVLSRRGLVPALRAHLATMGVVDVLQVQALGEQSRLPEATEAAAYFCCVAALGDVARPVSVRLDLRDGLLVLDVVGPAAEVSTAARPPQEAWFAEPAVLADRIDAAGGLLRRDRGPDGTIALHAELPLPALSPL
jgi:hypothetical protein